MAAARRRPRPIPKANGTPAGAEAAAAADLRDLRAQARRAQELERLVAQLEVYHEETRGQNEQLMETQAALEQSLARFADLYDHAPAAYFTLDRNGVILDINSAGLDMLQTSKSAATGVPLLFCIAQPDRAKYLELIRLARLQENKPSDAERSTLTADLNIRTRNRPITPVQISLRLASGELRRGGMYLRAIITDLTDRKKAEQQLQRYQEQLAAMAVESAMSAERERRRIAVEVHDTLSQSLVLAKMKLAALVRNAGSAAGTDLSHDLADVTNLIEEVLGQTRTLTFELSPPILYELGLEPALEWLAERVTKRTGLDVRIESRRHSVKLSEERAVLMFQLVRELLNNVVKHARAKEAAIRVGFRGGNVLVTLTDNGTGFDPASLRAGTVGTTGSSGAEHGGFGLLSIRTRLEHLRGSLYIDSAPGGPTRVALSLPIPSGED